jgi:hypothetical protein
VKRETLAFLDHQVIVTMVLQERKVNRENQVIKEILATQAEEDPKEINVLHVHLLQLVQKEIKVALVSQEKMELSDFLVKLE